MTSVPIPTIPVEGMNREELVAEIMWNSGGYGFGGDVGASMMWSMDRPGPGHPDLSSIVLVQAPPELYSDDELRLIVEFSRERTAHYDEMFLYRRGANLILIGRPSYNPTKWLRKRMTWSMGPMYSDSLEEALEFMRK